MNNHTEGPWRVESRRRGDNGELQTQIVEAYAGIILSRLDQWRDEAHEEELANATLMAAAPDLLQALNGLLEWSFDTSRPSGHLRDSARAAISKATGGNL